LFSSYIKKYLSFISKHLRKSYQGFPINFLENTIFYSQIILNQFEFSEILYFQEFLPLSETNRNILAYFEVK